MGAEDKTVKKTVQKVADALTKDLPELAKANKFTAVGALLGYFFADKLKENEAIITAVVGGLVGHAVDEKKKKDVF